MTEAAEQYIKHLEAVKKQSETVVYEVYQHGAKSIFAHDAITRLANTLLMNKLRHES